MMLPYQQNAGETFYCSTPGKLNFSVDRVRVGSLGSVKAAIVPIVSERSGARRSEYEAQPKTLFSQKITNEFHIRKQYHIINNSAPKLTIFYSNLTFF